MRFVDLKLFTYVGDNTRALLRVCQEESHIPEGNSNGIDCPYFIDYEGNKSEQLYVTTEI